MKIKNVCVVGWSDLKKIKRYTFFVVQNCCRTPIPKFHVLKLHFHLSQGLRKWAKQMFYLTFERLHLKQHVFFSLFKRKNWRETQYFFCFPLNRPKTIWTIFSEFSKNIKQLLISNFLLVCILYKEGFCKETKTIFIFRSLRFFENENTLAAKFADFF